MSKLLLSSRRWLWCFVLFCLVLVIWTLLECTIAVNVGFLLLSEVVQLMVKELWNWFQVIMSSKLTVSRLRDELEKRGLDTTGLKPVLVYYSFEQFWFCHDTSLILLLILLFIFDDLSASVSISILYLGHCLMHSGSMKVGFLAPRRPRSSNLALIV